MITPYVLDIPEEIDKIFLKLGKRDKIQLEAIHKKIKQILQDPHHFKPMRGDMKGSRRVHIDSSFVLTYEIDEVNKVVKVLDYDHHDNIYD
ncbi:MAG TPA: type II toxin-antitoxin system mRNA interferase toxin, RelE/StbE family [Candidatus Nanoarchaeia archaeon]|nr:type II toxin-antitoxin system mRNA interferase toxin, RelE/StbE family [Candidatus Nanoarchaeia archaeon]